MSTSALRCRLTRAAFDTPTPSVCHQWLSRRTFSTSPSTSSKIGSSPLVIPPGVNLRIYSPPPPKYFTRVLPERTVTVEGPLGQVTIPIPHFLNINQTAPPEGSDIKSSKASVSVKDPKVRQQRKMWGTVRALLANNILGVTEGHAALVRFVGVGYRAIIQDGGGRFNKGKKVVNLKLGYSHPVLLPVPEGVTASAPVPTRLLLEGINKESVNSFAAEIRRWRVPEPYKGKGLFVNDETIKMKAKKIK
ncbi:hypothetical protein H072_4021 [Dactylellina haptotyla CBS 200.50]|uniref:Large ribosomal subunit protein uL6 alpha-beta domain-containing protein n=1 Tax=Dactylellina haptotyla (strain CBS 200.50) TaxID=1284197 RepID=S8AGM4_DACHA|nr:hypothetical protein H072_4021 [Dactylellina haptotyla CBS 200.50]